MSQFKTD
jgi:hypothetical protein